VVLCHYWQMLVQVEVGVLFAVQTRKQASRGDSGVLQSVHSSVEYPQVDRHVEVGVRLATQTS